MEFGLREWMILISGLLIIVVIVDGVRRMLADRRNHIRMGMSYGDDGEDDDYFDEQNPELPNGGARIVNHRTGSTSEPVIGSLDIDEKEFLSRQRVTASMADAVGRAQRADGFESLSASRDLDVDPLALDPLDDVEESDRARMIPEREAQAKRGAPKKEAERGSRLRMPSFKRAASQPEASETDESSPAESAAIADQNTASESESIVGVKKTAGTDKSDRSAGEQANQEQEQAGKPQVADQLQEVLVINVFARDNNGFNGGDLLEVLLACDVRFGEMNIFHRYESSKGSGPVQFSIANLVKPGTFELETIKEFYTPGITMFMQLPGPVDPLAAFDCMAEVASCIVRNLQGEMRDEGHSVLTQQTLEHYRERIRDFERKRLMLGQRKV